MHRLVPFLLAALALAMVPASARAHAVGLEWRFRGDQVVIDVFYDDDSPAVRAKVRVLDGDKEIETGLTDEKGGWSFARPAPGRYTIDVDAGAGHTVRETIAVPQIGADTETTQKGDDGRRRDNFTRFPWVGLLLGLLIIAGLAGAFVLFAAFRKGIRGN